MSLPNSIDIITRVLAQPTHVFGNGYRRVALSIISPQPLWILPRRSEVNPTKSPHQVTTTIQKTRVCNKPTPMSCPPKSTKVRANRRPIPENSAERLPWERERKVAKRRQQNQIDTQYSSEFPSFVLSDILIRLLTCSPMAIRQRTPIGIVT